MIEQRLCDWFLVHFVWLAWPFIQAMTTLNHKVEVIPGCVCILSTPLTHAQLQDGYWMPSETTIIHALPPIRDDNYIYSIVCTAHDWLTVLLLILVIRSEDAFKWYSWLIGYSNGTILRIEALAWSTPFTQSKSYTINNASLLFHYMQFANATFLCWGQYVFKLI